MIDKALALAAKGFRVFPCQPNGKTPAVKAWQKVATTDEDKIRKWWKRTPNANIGVLCGDGLTVIDFDLQKEGSLESFKQLQKDGMPRSLSISTPSGGLHVYYRVTEPIKTCSAWMPGVDIRGDGGYVIGPGSVRDDIGYAVRVDEPIAMMPAYLVAATKKQEKKKTSASSLITSGDNTYSTLPEAVPFGERDDTIFRYASSWRARGLNLQQATILAKELHARCEQSQADEYTVDMVIEKVQHVYDTYEEPEQNQQPAGAVPSPAGSPPPTPADSPSSAPAGAPPSIDTFSRFMDMDEGAAIKEAVNTLVLIDAGPRVADLRAHPTQAIRTLQEFKTKGANIWLGDRQLPMVWLSHRDRITVANVQMHPSEARLFERGGVMFYNPWYGSSLELPEVIDPYHVRVPMEHLEYLIPEKKHRSYFVRWMCMLAQHPEIRIPWMPLVISVPGTGKSWIYELLKIMFGEHNCSMLGSGDTDTMFQYNDYMTKLLVCLEDMKSSRKYDLTNKLKPLLTSTTLEINKKFGSKGQEWIFAKFLGFSNDTRGAVALEPGDRRFWVYESKAVPQTAAYYDMLFDWLKGEGPAHWLRFLQTISLDGWHYAAPPPMTDAKKKLIRSSRSDIEQTLLDMMEDKVGIFQFDIMDLDLIYKALARRIGLDRLDRVSRQCVNHAVDDLGALPKEKYAVTLRGTTLQFRLMAIRNQDKWAKATDEQIAEEYEKAWTISVGGRI